MTMFTDADIFWQKEWHPFEYTGADRTQYAVYAVVIDDEIVDVRPYKKSFIDLYNNNTFVETGFSDGKYKIDIVNEDSLVVDELELSELLGSMFLSNPIVVKVTDQTSYASVGMKYINGKIVKL